MERRLPGNLSIIARGATDLAYRRIAPHLSDYMGHVFEEICKQYLWHVLLHDASPVQFTDLGRWWGTDQTTRNPMLRYIFLRRPDLPTPA